MPDAFLLDSSAFAARLRKETTLPVKWIAARVKIGTTNGATSVLHRLAHAATARHNESGAQLEFQSTVWRSPLDVPDFGFSPVTVS